MEAELVEDVPDVVLDRVLADVERVADLAAGHALGNELEHLDLPAGQRRLASLEELLVAEELAAHIEELAGHHR